MSSLAPWKVSSIVNVASGTSYSTSNTVASDMTLSPDGVSPAGVFSYVDRTGGIPILFPRATLALRRPTAGSRNYKASVRFSLPTADITSPSTGSGIQPAPSKAYDNTFIGEFIMPERGTASEKLKLLSYVASMFFPYITAADGSPVDTTASPLYALITALETPYG